ncbi:hypothetical protein [Crassaminicella profunda]|uniref:hypothetical protein n=1 Tax=Crassaminicella profunda TaxID=1286698 RepID=UPI001CA78DD0|nr:hypothetical protein [Crassaminicella profunda]QZY56186.1 hypothetical protein K7H06_04120 [Crassaminicella profunda]
MIKTYAQSKLSSMHKYIIIGIGIVFIGYSIYDQQYFKILLGLILIYACYFEKNIFIEDEGLRIQIKRIGTKKERIIKFDEMQEMSHQTRNDKTMFFFSKDNMIYKVMVDAINVNKVVRLVKKKNKKIKIYYLE